MMAKIYVTDKERKADAEVFLVKNDYQADLLFYEESKDYKAKGDELWCFVDQERKADFIIYWTDKEYKADLKVFKVDKDYKAKWKKSHAFKSRIG